MTMSATKMRPALTISVKIPAPHHTLLVENKHSANQSLTELFVFVLQNGQAILMSYASNVRIPNGTT